MPRSQVLSRRRRKPRLCGHRSGRQGQWPSPHAASSQTRLRVLSYCTCLCKEIHL